MINKKFKNVLTKKDFFIYLIIRNTFILTTPLIILALIFGFIYVSKTDGYQNNDLIFLVPILILFLVYFQMYSSIKKASLDNEVEIKIDENSYTEVSNTAVTTLELEKFNAYFENKNYFYLYVDKINALILPKREFEEEEISNIRKYFSSKIKKVTYFTFKNVFNLLLAFSLIISIFLIIIEII